MAAATDFNAFLAGAEPNEAEVRVIEASKEGKPADLRDLAEDDRRISAALVAAIAINTFAHSRWPDWAQHAHGPMIAHATIAGTLDLQFRRIGVGLRFADCRLEAVRINDATIEGPLWFRKCSIVGLCDLSDSIIVGGVDAAGTTFTNLEGDAVFARGLRSKFWHMNDAIVLGRFAINSAELAEQFSANGAKFERTSGDAIFAQGLKASSWYMDNANVLGRVAINSAQLSGQFAANQASFENGSGDAIRAQGLKAAGWFLNNTTVTGRLAINSAQLSGQFNANGSSFENGSGIAIRAQALKATGWYMRDAKVIGRLDINSVHIFGQINLNNCTVEIEIGDAINAQGAKCTEFFTDESEIHGCLNLAGADLSGQFSAVGTNFKCNGGDAIFAQAARAKSWQINTARVLGCFDISSAQISGQFNANGSIFEYTDRDAIFAQAACVTDWFMNDADITGCFDINAANIGGIISASGTSFKNRLGAAVEAQGVVSTGWFMDNAIVAGTFSLRSADIAGQFAADGARFDNGNKIALLFEYSTISGGIFIRDGATIVGGVSFDSATIRKAFDISGVELSASDWPALSLERATIDADVHCANAVISGCIDASRAHFSSTLDLRSAMLTHGSTSMPRWRHHAVILREARIDGRLIMPERVPDGIVDLSHAQCGIYEDFASGWPGALPKGQEVCLDRLHVDHEGRKKDIQHLVLDGFRYAHFEHPDGEDKQEADAGAARKLWLTSQPVAELVHRFNPQPWRQATAVLRDMGYDDAAKAVAIKRRDLERAAKNAPRTQRWINTLLRIVADYGYNPRKTLFWCAGIIFACMALFWSGTQICGGGSNGTTTCNGQPLFIQTEWGTVAPKDIGANYPAFDPLSFSLGAFVPLFDLGSEEFWRANPASGVWYSIPVWLGAPNSAADTAPPHRWSFAFSWSWGLTFYWLFVLERIAGAILIAIAITGFTGFLTRDER